LESTDEACLAQELKLQQINFEQQKRLSVNDKGITIDRGGSVIDLLISLPNYGIICVNNFWRNTEAVGVDFVVLSFRQKWEDDKALLEKGLALFDALYDKLSLFSTPL
jgi:hypothetical protein